MVKILLVYPVMPPTFWTMDYLIQMVGKKASYPPLGLLTLASLLPEDWKKQLVDLNVEPLTDEQLLWADKVMISAMNVQQESAQQVISRCKELGVEILAGGPLFTHEYEIFPEVDHFILNEAELTLPRYLEDLKNGEPEYIYKTPEFANVHETPVPMWSLIDLSKYAYAIIQYSRGCPFQCDFCDVTALFGRNPRTKTPEQIISELDALGDFYQFGMVLFADDNLIGNKKHLKSELLPALIDWRKKKNPAIAFATQVTINLADDQELIDLMLEAGFRHIFIGIETPEEESLVACKKGQNTKRDLLTNVKKLQKDGFIVTAGFIVGFDTDTTETFKRQVDFIQDSGIVIATINILKAPPGTDLFRKMKEKNRLVESFDFDENRTNIIPIMPESLLYNGFEEVLRNVYSDKSVYERAMNLLLEYDEPNVKYPVYRKTRIVDIVIFIRILFNTGVLAKQRSYVWKLMWWTLRKKPHLLDLACLFSVMIVQLGKMYTRYLRSAKKSGLLTAKVNKQQPTKKVA